MITLLKKLTIGLDFDGTIVDHTQIKIKKAKELGYNLKPHETHSNYLEKIITKKDLKIIQKYIYDKATLESPPVKDALKIIRKLAKNYKLIIISRREPNFQEITIKWLKKNRVFKNIPRKHVFFSLNDIDKKTIAKKNDVSIFIDDKIKILNAMDGVPSKIIFDQFNIIENSDFHKIKKWQELPAVISKLIKNT